MKVNIPLMIQDPSTIISGKDIVEGFIPEENFFLSGPVTDRIAVLNFDENGGINVSAFFKAPSPKRKLGRYMDAPEKGKDIRKSENIYSDAFRSVAAFSMVLKTLYLFEGTDEKKIDTLGRKLTWAFDSPQLFVIPDAGKWANAFYCRDSNSLHFFHFYPNSDPKKKIYTGLSRDIVAHETGHAVVDGIAPDLFDSCSPQSLAIHEAMADLTAMLVAFQSNELREYVLKGTKGHIDKPSMFSSMAEEFGKELYRTRGCLRALHEFTSMNPEHGEAYVGSFEPHNLSRVLSNALYDVMLKIYQQVWDEEAQKPKYLKYDDPKLSSSGASLWIAAARFKRMIFRGLDVLPPGDISFADYGRAIMAVDTVAYDTSDYRDWIKDEFIRRSIVKNEDALKTDTHLDKSVGNDAWEIYESDYSAYKFAENERELLYIPKNVRFEVHPRHLVHKKYENDVEKTECLFKVSWSHVEDNSAGSGLPPQRMIIVGTTLVFDMETGNVLLRLSNAPPLEGDAVTKGRISGIEYEEQRDQRNRFINKLADEDVIKFGKDAYGPDGETPLLSAVRAEGLKGVMRVWGTGKTLHILEETDLK